MSDKECPRCGEQCRRDEVHTCTINYRRVEHPEQCAREGSGSLGGHCAICGSDLSPGVGTEVKENVITCPAHFSRCLAMWTQGTERYRSFWLGLPAIHVTSFGDHGCYDWHMHKALVRDIDQCGPEDER